MIVCSLIIYCTQRSVFIYVLTLRKALRNLPKRCILCSLRYTSRAFPSSASCNEAVKGPQGKLCDVNVEIYLIKNEGLLPLLLALTIMTAIFSNVRQAVRCRQTFPTGKGNKEEGGRRSIKSPIFNFEPLFRDDQRSKIRFSITSFLEP